MKKKVKGAYYCEDVGRCIIMENESISVKRIKGYMAIDIFYSYMRKLNING